MLKDAKVLYVNDMVIFAATLHCALDDLLNQTADAWGQIRFFWIKKYIFSIFFYRKFVESEEAHKADLLCREYGQIEFPYVLFFSRNEPLFV